jgi:hypothetical protein
MGASPPIISNLSDTVDDIDVVDAWSIYFSFSSQGREKIERVLIEKAYSVYVVYVVYASLTVQRKEDASSKESFAEPEQAPIARLVNRCVRMFPHTS